MMRSLMLAVAVVRKSDTFDFIKTLALSALIVGGGTIAVCGLLAMVIGAPPARADPPTTVLVTQTVQTLTATESAALTGTGAGIRMLCIQNIGTGLVTLNFDDDAVAGAGYALNVAGGAGQGGGSICWTGDTVPRSVVHAISTAGSVVAVLVGR